MCVPLALFTKLSPSVRSHWSIRLILKFVGFAQGVPELREFYLGVYFPTNFHCPLAAKRYVGCEYDLEVKMVDFVYHYAEFCGTWISRTADWVGEKNRCS